MLIESSLRKGKAVKDNAGFDRKLNKTVALNSDNVLFMRLTPVFKEDSDEIDFMDLIAATVPGRSTDYNVCGASYIKLDKTQMVQDESTKKWKDISGLDDWARIAKVLHKAECQSKKKLKELEVTTIATAMKTPIDQTQLNNDLEKIELEYFGGKGPTGQPIYATVNPIISGLQYKMTTQVLVVPMVHDKPEWDKAATAYMEISNDRMSEIIGLLENPKYCSIGDEFLEVGYSFKGTDTKEAGRKAKLEGVTKEYRLSTLFPEEWKTQGLKALDKMVKGPTLEVTAELMAGRNINLSSSKTPSDIESCIRKYCATNPGVITCIDVESEEVKSAAKALYEKGIVDAMPEIKNSLKALIDAQEAANNEAKEEAKEASVPSDETDAQTQVVMETVVNTEEARTLTELASKIDNIDAISGSEFEGEM